jgi:hypothetical protein
MKTLSADLNSAPCLQAYWWETQPYHALRCHICRCLITNLKLAKLNVKSCHYSLDHNQCSPRWNAALPYIGPKHLKLGAVPRQRRHSSRVTASLAFCFLLRQGVQKLKTKFYKVQVHVHTKKLWCFTWCSFKFRSLFSYVLPSYLECTFGGANLAKTGNHSKYELLWSLSKIVTFHLAVL